MVDSLSLVSRSAKETQQIGIRMGRLASSGDLFLLVGRLGTGKTCLTQGIAWGLGVKGYATSPSFVVINHYQGRLPLFHIDLYRLDRIEEIIELGVEDLLSREGVFVVEWAEKGLEVIPKEHLLVEMSFLSDVERGIVFRARGERYLNMLSKLGQRARKWSLP